jgi:hypothetical protein
MSKIAHANNNMTPCEGTSEVVTPWGVIVKMLPKEGVFAMCGV